MKSDRGRTCPCRRKVNLRTTPSTRYLATVDPVIAPSARKRGYADEDLLHAYRNVIRVVPGDEGFTMLVGSNQAGTLMEIGVVTGELGPVIVHAMSPPRDKYLEG